ncbi:hypothetical protein M4951_16530 [Blastopirellula sp. J2-11]|uniref:hypothetical protein n=1 Tax=Blastopirellula sp. J2-11 TaxID=2943192 RepID=UPI0021C978E7|nr:hypothetical protein [Blastopirellula sp. J2-11]UUO04986.1 hypothetical protein M4951_16530 [Blastopirellula sp. J2-11]
MQADPKWYLLGAILLVFMAITVPRMFHFRDFSDQEGYEICLAIQTQCKELKARKASDADWEAFQQEALPKLDAIADDIENYSTSKRGLKSPASTNIYQIARYNLPKQIQSKSDGVLQKNIKGKDASRQPDMDRSIAEILRVINMPKEPQVQRNKPQLAQKNQNSWDPIVVGIVCVDMLAMAGGLGYWFWPKR